MSSIVTTAYKNEYASSFFPEPSKMPRRYNLRSRDKDVKWVEDDTLDKSETETEKEDSDYEPEEDSCSEDEDDVTLVDEDEDDEEQQVVLPKNAKVSVQLHIHSVIGDARGIRIDTGEDSEEEEEEDEFIDYLMNKYVKNKKDKDEDINLNDEEEDYLEEQPKSRRKELQAKMSSISKVISNGGVPYKFRVLELPISDDLKAAVIKKVDTMNEMSEDGNEVHKLRTWIDGFLRIPFGKNIPLPVTLSDDRPQCAKFLSDARKTMDKAVYGMVPAKTHIMQILAQWVSNPASVGNVIALKGPMGVGKTSFARSGVAEVLKRPFHFFSLGGAADAATFVGHSYTYEGSIWGRVADAVMRSKCMNPVLYFDELDKISTTAHGEEIVSLLIHLTDRSQNSQFHDRYFAGVDFDLSQCLFVFSFNDESKVHPVLKDRMQVVTCDGYSAKEKEVILTEHALPQILERNSLQDMKLSSDAIKYLIQRYSDKEEGVRNLIRAVETLVTRINLLRIVDEETGKAYKFYTPITLPCEISKEMTEHILQDSAPKEESWRNNPMYL
jgi:ATP-dependent Lon protease